LREDINLEDKMCGALVGLACGDAVGTTLEFKPRGSFAPIDDMVGGGPFKLERGQWTDDTSMALCLAHSLLHAKGFDPLDQINRYCNWYHHGYMSCTGHCFDIGITVTAALNRYLETKDPFSGSTDPQTSGNGSIMRLAPVVIYFSRNAASCLHYAEESSKTTHASKLCLDSCRLFADLILRAATASSKDEVFTLPNTEGYCDELQPLLDSSFKKLDYRDINGSGYVIDSLISALWCFYHGKDFKDAILLSSNIGNDADTTAAICGQIAGAYYGYSGIPKDWRESIAMAEEIKQLAIDLYQKGPKS